MECETMTDSIEATKKRLSELTHIVAELESSLHKRAGENVDHRGIDNSRKRPRSVTACNKCRSLKIRCERDPSSQAPCARCAELKVQCEIEKCKRGRVRGSKNKDKSVDFRPIGAPESIPPPSSSGTAEPEPVPCHRQVNEDTFDPLSGERLQLPLESARHSPEVEDRYLRDGPHPLSLLSNVAWSMLAAAEEPQQVGDIEASDAQGPQECLLPGWTLAQLQRASKQKQAYYRYGLNAIKRDVAPKLDPITRGIVSDDEAAALVAGFFRCLQPQVGIMDPTLHTVDYLRAHSCLLLTAVLAAAAQTDTTADAHHLADTLYLHAERLFLIAISSDAKSPEIVLALLVLYLWPKFPEKNVDDRSRIFLTLAINMSVELGFPRLPRDISGDLMSRRQHRDLIRTWTDLYIHDRSLSAFSGRPPLIKAHAGADEMRSWLQDKELATLGDHMIIGYLELRAIENESRTRLAEITQPYLASAVKLSTLAQLEAWTQEWCEGALRGTAFAHMMEFVALHLALLIRSKGVAEVDASGNEDQMRNLAQRSLDYLLHNMTDNARFTCRTVCAMITWNAVILLKLSGDSARSTVRTVGLALAPFGDGRMDQGAAFFYGSLLLELSFDNRLSAVDGPLNPLHGIMPSPSTLWVLQQSILPAGQTPALIPPVFKTSETDVGRSTEPVFGYDFPIWNDAQGPASSDEPVFPSIFTDADPQPEWQGMSSDWSWLFDDSNPF